MKNLNKTIIVAVLLLIFGSCVAPQPTIIVSNGWRLFPSERGFEPGTILTLSIGKRGDTLSSGYLTRAGLSSNSFNLQPLNFGEEQPLASSLNYSSSNSSFALNTNNSFVNNTVALKGEVSHIKSFLMTVNSGSSFGLLNGSSSAKDIIRNLSIYEQLKLNDYCKEAIVNGRRPIMITEVVKYNDATVTFLFDRKISQQAKVELAEYYGTKVSDSLSTEKVTLNNIKYNNNLVAYKYVELDFSIFNKSNNVYAVYTVQDKEPIELGKSESKTVFNLNNLQNILPNKKVVIHADGQIEPSFCQGGNWWRETWINVNGSTNQFHEGGLDTYCGTKNISFQTSPIPIPANGILEVKLEVHRSETNGTIMKVKYKPGFKVWVEVTD